MRAILAESTERMTIQVVPDVAAQDSQVVIKVAAAGVNRADLLQAAGNYPPPPGASDVIGLEVSGTIAQVGNNVTEWAVGQPVCALLAGGGYAEYVAVPATQVMPVPDGVGLHEAAALPEVACTVWSNLVDAGRLTAGIDLSVGYLLEKGSTPAAAATTRVRALRRRSARSIATTCARGQRRRIATDA